MIDNYMIMIHTHMLYMLNIVLECSYLSLSLSQTIWINFTANILIIIIIVSPPKRQYLSCS